MSLDPEDRTIIVNGVGNSTAGRDINYFHSSSEWAGLSKEVLLVHRAQQYREYVQAVRHQRWNKPFFFQMFLGVVMLAFGCYLFFFRFTVMLGSGLGGLAKHGVTIEEMVFLGVLVLLTYVTQSRFIKVRREQAQVASAAAAAIQKIDVELRRIQLHTENF